MTIRTLMEQTLVERQRRWCITEAISGWVEGGGRYGNWREGTRSGNVGAKQLEHTMAQYPVRN